MSGLLFPPQEGIQLVDENIQLDDISINSVTLADRLDSTRHKLNRVRSELKLLAERVQEIDDTEANRQDTQDRSQNIFILVSILLFVCVSILVLLVALSIKLL